MMSLEASSGLIETLRGLDILASGQLEHITREMAGKNIPARDLARSLIERDWLTAFQANQILTGKGQSLLLGPYVLMARIGTGGMGEVFKSRHRRLLRICAVKVIGHNLLENNTARERFIREAEAAAQLSHPNIVAVHDAGVDGERYYLSMEFIDGLDMSKLLQQCGPLPVALACDFIRQAALGLHHAHEQGYVHRDIKPQNLLVAPKGGLKSVDSRSIGWLAGAIIKVLDMGLVRHQAATAEATEMALTQRGIVIGTMDYVAPEQARNARSVDRRADLYSLGCTLYHLLAGQPPFAGGQALEKLLRHQTDEAPPLSSRRPDVPPRVIQIIKRLMAKQPEQRYSTGLELVHELTAVSSSNPTAPLIVVDSPALVPTVSEFSPQFSQSVMMASGEQLQHTEALALGEETLSVLSGPIAPRIPTARPDPFPRWPMLLGGIIAALALILILRGLAIQTSNNSNQPETKKVPEKPVTPPVVEKPAVDHLVHFFPPDTFAVVQVRPQVFLTAGIFRRKQKEKPVSTPIDLAGKSVMEAMKIVPSDVDWVRFAYPASSTGVPSWLLRAGGNRTQFNYSPDKSIAIKEQDGHSIMEFPNASPQPIFAAESGPYLIASTKVERTVAYVNQASQGTVNLNQLDENLRNSYIAFTKKNDNKTHLWFAVAPKKLGTIPKPKTIDEGLIGEILSHCRLIDGSATFNANSLSGDIVLHTYSNQSAEKVFNLVEGYILWTSYELKYAPPEDHLKKVWLQYVSRMVPKRTANDIYLHATVSNGAKK